MDGFGTITSISERILSPFWSLPDDKRRELKQDQKSNQAFALPCDSVPGKQLRKQAWLCNECSSASSLLSIPARTQLAICHLPIDRPASLPQPFHSHSRNHRWGARLSTVPGIDNLQSSSWICPGAENPWRDLARLMQFLAAAPVTCKCWRARSRMGEVPEPKTCLQRAQEVLSRDPLCRVQVFGSQLAHPLIVWEA